MHLWSSRQRLLGLYLLIWLLQFIHMKSIQKLKLKENFIGSLKNLLLSLLTHGLQETKLTETKSGADFKGINCLHPFIERRSPILSAEYVTTDSGTGCVHIAPGHGLDDYHIGLENALDIYCPLDDNGCYADDDDMPDELVGLSVLEKQSGCAANQKVIEILRDSSSLLAEKKHNHQYPHCWRSKTLSCSEQWTNGLSR